jgi:hypothetical protein
MLIVHSDDLGHANQFSLYNVPSSSIDGHQKLLKMRIHT